MVHGTTVHVTITESFPKTLKAVKAKWTVGLLLVFLWKRANSTNLTALNSTRQMPIGGQQTISHWASVEFRIRWCRCAKVWSLFGSWAVEIDRVLLLAVCHWLFSGGFNSLILSSYLPWMIFFDGYKVKESARYAWNLCACTEAVLCLILITVDPHSLIYASFFISFNFFTLLGGRWCWFMNQFMALLSWKDGQWVRQYREWWSLQPPLSCNRCRIYYFL